MGYRKQNCLTSHLAPEGNLLIGWGGRGKGGNGLRAVDKVGWKRNGALCPSEWMQTEGDSRLWYQRLSIGEGVQSCLDIQQGYPFVLVATLPAVYHLRGKGHATGLGSGLSVP